jgi:Putative Ig domain
VPIKLRPLTVLLCLLTGCSVAPVAVNSSGSGTQPSPSPAAVTGVVYGLQQPIQGAQIYLLAVGTGSSGTSSSSLMTKKTADTDNTGSINSSWYYVKTGLDGTFTIASADYSCKTGQEVYLYSLGGDPQVAGTNAVASLMAVLGQCTAPGTFSGLPAKVQMNEVTTVAAAYALAGFATDSTHIAAPSTTPAAFLNNAVLNAGNLVDLGTGMPYTTTPAANGGNGTVPSDEIITLANLLGACVNTNGAVTGGGNPTNCYRLFNNALSPTGGVPNDTATAAINIAHSPGANVDNLWQLVGAAGGDGAFIGGLTAEPNDFTIAINYTDASLNGSTAAAVDTSGDVWVTNHNGNSITEFAPQGQVLGSHTDAGMVGPNGVAIDASGNIWVANNNSTLSEYKTGSQTFASLPNGGGLDTPIGIAVDGSGFLWTANESAGISKFRTSDGSALSPDPSGYTGGGLSTPYGIAIDGFGNAWSGNLGNGAASISELSGADGSPLSPDGGFTGGGLNQPISLAVDSSENVWVANYGNNSISEFDSAGGKLSPDGTGYNGGGLSGPWSLAIDGVGNLWVANNTAISGVYGISEFNSTGHPMSGSNGYQFGGLDSPKGIAVDGSGDVWVVSSGNGTVAEFIGAAWPAAATPLVNQPFNLAITTVALPDGTQQSPYSTTLAAIGGTKPYSWSLTSGTLPSGLFLNASTGVISGTPGAPVTDTPLTFSVTDSSSSVQTQSVSLTLTIAPSSDMTVSVMPRNAGMVAGQTLVLTATTSDPSGVNWSASGAGCSGSGCGTFSAASTLSGVPVTYTAPAAAGAYTITATSVTETVVTASVGVGVTDLAGVTTYHNDGGRTGANQQEYALTPSNVNTATFGKLFSCPVDSTIYTQPLWVPNVTISGGSYPGTHNVVFVATTADSLYAFDADKSPCEQLWKVSLIDTSHGAPTSGELPVPSSGTGALVGQRSASGGDIQPETGVIGTPVIDSSTGTLYVVSKSYVAGPTIYQRLHAIDLSTGGEKFAGSPVNISASVSGTGDGGATVTFNAGPENQRCGLALSNGVVYVAWASHEDQNTPNAYGWVIGYHESDLSQVSAFNAAPNGTLNGIWMSGGAPAIGPNGDPDSGDLYVITGNGTFDVTNSTGPTNDYQDSFLQLSPSLGVNEYFSPTYTTTDSEAGDHDLGAGGATVLIDLPTHGANPTHLIVGGGKMGYFYVLNRDALGGFGDSKAWQEVSTLGQDGIFATGAFWNYTFYLGAQAQSLEAFTLDPSTAKMTAVATATNHQFGFPGTTPSISSTSSDTNGILWALDTNSYCTQRSHSCGPAILYAYDATNLGDMLWNSAQAAGDAAGNAVKFQVPTVANGHVYVGTRGNNAGGADTSTSTPGELDVYGLLP